MDWYINITYHSIVTIVCPCLRRFLVSSVLTVLPSLVSPLGRPVDAEVEVLVALVFGRLLSPPIVTASIVVLVAASHRLCVLSRTEPERHAHQNYSLAPFSQIDDGRNCKITTIDLQACGVLVQYFLCVPISMVSSLLARAVAWCPPRERESR